MIYVQYTGQPNQTFSWNSEGQSYLYRVKTGDVIVIPESQLGYLLGYGNFFVVLENYVGVAVTAESKDGVVAEGSSKVGDVMVAADTTAHRIKSSGKTLAELWAEDKASELLVGQTGATGPVGATGPSGATGATGPIGATGPGISSADITTISKVTQAQYDAITGPSSSTLYVIVG